MEPKTPEEIAAVQKYRTSIPLTESEMLLIHDLRNASLMGDESPVPLASRQAGFSGIRFFPIDLSYQLRLRLHKYDVPGHLQISLSDGSEVTALRAGFFEFELGGKKHKLNVYKKRASDTEMFLPFRDKTSGNETYGSGRYIDVYENPNGEYVIDFNMAYNPLCALDATKYDCPLPPAENWLMNVEIRAGEMKFKD